MRTQKGKTMPENPNPDRAAKPWDLLDPTIGRVAEDIAHSRLELCKSCDHFVTLLHLCGECGCIMDAKVKLPNAFCPLRKWTTSPAVNTGHS